MAVRQLDLVRDTVLRREYPAQAKPAARKSDGQFTSLVIASNGLPDAIAGAVCAGYFASVCRLMGIDRTEAKELLAQPSAGARRVDRAWRRAAYARQLAMYLTATEANIPQAQIGRITGLDRAGVHKALRAVEDLRDDHADYEQLITCVLVDVSMNGLQS